MNMALDPHIAAFLEAAQSSAASKAASLESTRQATEVNLRKLHGPLEPVASVKTYSVPGHAGHAIRIRAYVPAAVESTRAAPAIVYAHGGGWFQCSLDLYDNPCRALASATRCIVMSVDYRLAPEYQFPVPLEDFYAALCWVGQNATTLGIDPAHILVGGDSAGANLAAGTALLARERGGPAIAHQLLLYPPLDYSFSTPSYTAFAEGYFLTRATMQFCWNNYLGTDEAKASPYASPLRALNLKGLPSATILVNEYDPLRDDGETYALRLREAGVNVSSTRLSGLVHASIHMLGLTPRARQLFELAGEAVQRTLKNGGEVGA